MFLARSSTVGVPEVVGQFELSSVVEGKSSKKISTLTVTVAVFESPPSGRVPPSLALYVNWSEPMKLTSGV